jgi:hypothetical protein
VNYRLGSQGCTGTPTILPISVTGDASHIGLRCNAANQHLCQAPNNPRCAQYREGDVPFSCRAPLCALTDNDGSRHPKKEGIGMTVVQFLSIGA